MRSQFQQALAACEHGWPNFDSELMMQNFLFIANDNVKALPGKKRVPETAAAAEEIAFQ